MENNNGYSKYIAIIALLISVVGVSLGFAAFTNTVQIKARADYTAPNDTPVGELSTSPSSQTDGPITPTTEGGATAENANLDEDSIENISVHFTAPGQKATYSFYGVNTSAFTSYLNEVTFGTKACTPGTGTTASYVEDACNDIIMTITAGSDEFTATDTDVNGHSLASGGNEPIVVEIEYIDGGNVADGDFTVDFGTSTLKYGTVD